MRSSTRPVRGLSNWGIARRVEGVPTTWRSAMQIAGSVRLDDVLERLKLNRPVFHSEADFQHHLAWEMHLMDPALQIRLEVRPDAAMREQVDLLVSRPGTGQGTVIELKYLKAAWEGHVGDEPFKLLNSGAHDIVLTNDAMHWRPPVGIRQTIAEAFRIHEGSVLAGERGWGPGAGDGTTKGRSEALAIRGTYELAWRDYSSLGGRNGDFRLLVVPVTAVVL